VDLWRARVLDGRQNIEVLLTLATRARDTVERQLDQERQRVLARVKGAPAEALYARPVFMNVAAGERALRRNRSRAVRRRK
jgi:hypothetical protein